MAIKGLGAGLLAAVLAWSGEPAKFRLEGRLVPESPAVITLYGATTPFAVFALSDSRGRFEVKNLPAGSYTLSVFIRSRGELRNTIVVGSGTSDGKGVVPVTVEWDDSRLNTKALEGSHKVSARDLSIPDGALRAYAEALKRLSRRDVDGAVAKLNAAVKLAPQFANAWNHLGTIHYQTKRFPEAEKAFRTALEKDPEAYEPLVNLGGTLLSLNRFDEALHYNLYAVLNRPGDALANSQLGINYLALGSLDLAAQYLTEAKRLDPAHFSRPQLTLAEVYLRKNEIAAAAAELEEYLRLHPDAPERAKLEATLKELNTKSSRPPR